MTKLERECRDLARSIVDRLQYKKLSSAKMIGEGGGAWCLDVSQLDGIEKPLLFSGGAGNNISFEKDFSEKFGGRVYLYDPSPTGKGTVERHPRIEGLVFTPAALAARGGGVRMAKPKDPGEGSWTVATDDQDDVDKFEAVSLVDEITAKGCSKVDVVKLDIEGFEYEVLEELLCSPIEVVQILVEFHDFFPNIPRSRTEELRNLLKRKGYECFFKSRYDFSFRRSSVSTQSLS